MRSVSTAGARALALSAVTTEPKDLVALLEDLRNALPEPVELWLGGPLATGMGEHPGIHVLDTLPRLEQRVELLRIAKGSV